MVHCYIPCSPITLYDLNFLVSTERPFSLSLQPHRPPLLGVLRFSQLPTDGHFGSFQYFAGTMEVTGPIPLSLCITGELQIR